MHKPRRLIAVRGGSMQAQLSLCELQIQLETENFTSDLDPNGNIMVWTHLLSVQIKQIMMETKRLPRQCCVLCRA